MTDEDGNFTLKSLPTGVKITVISEAVDDLTQARLLEEYFLQPNDVRPREVYRLGDNSRQRKKIALTRRYRATLRDCLLSGYHPLVIVSDEDPSVIAFVDKHFRDYDASQSAVLRPLLSPDALA